MTDSKSFSLLRKHDTKLDKELEKEVGSKVIRNALL